MLAGSSAVALRLLTIASAVGTDNHSAQVRASRLRCARGRRWGPGSRRPTREDPRSAVMAACVGMHRAAGTPACRLLSARVSIASAALSDRRAHHIAGDFRRCGPPSPGASVRRRPARWRRTGLRRACAGACRHCRGSDSITRSGRAAASARRAARELVPTSAAAGRSAKLAADDRVARVFALGSGRDLQTSGNLRGHVFQAVDGEVGAAVEQRFFDLFGEQALGSDLLQRAVGILSPVVLMISMRHSCPSAARRPLSGSPATGQAANLGMR